MSVAASTTAGTSSATGTAATNSPIGAIAAAAGDTKIEPAKRSITLWLPDGRPIGCVFISALQLSNCDLVRLRQLISAEFKDSGSESHIGASLADDLTHSRYTFLSSGAPITRKQEDTLTPLDFGLTLTLRPRSFGGTGGTRSAGPAIRRIKSSTGGYEDSFLSSGDKKDGGPQSVGPGGGGGSEHHDALSTAIMPSPSLHSLSTVLPPPPMQLSSRARSVPSPAGSPANAGTIIHPLTAITTDKPRVSPPAPAAGATGAGKSPDAPYSAAGSALFLLKNATAAASRLGSVAERKHSAVTLSTTPPGASSAAHIRGSSGADASFMAHSYQHGSGDDSDADHTTSLINKHSTGAAASADHDFERSAHGGIKKLDTEDAGELQITVIGRDKSQWEVFRSTKDVEEMNIDELESPVWIDVEGYSEADLNALGQKFALHPLTIEDCMVADPREKMEVFAHYMFLIFHASTAYDDDPEKADVQPIKLLLFAKCIISFHQRGLETLEHVRQRLSKLYSNRLESTSWVVHGMLDCIIDSHFSVVEATVNNVDALDDLIYALSRAEHRDILKRMAEARRRLSYMRQRLWSKRDILVSLVSKDWENFLSGVQIPYLRDVRMLQKLEIASELLSSIQSTYLSNVSIDVAEASNNVNAVMKTLSSVATIILPLTLVTGMFGMNVTVPWQANSPNAAFDDLLPFFILCALMVLIAVFMVWYFRRKRWL